MSSQPVLADLDHGQGLAVGFLYSPDPRQTTRLLPWATQGAGSAPSTANWPTSSCRKVLARPSVAGIPSLLLPVTDPCS